MTNLSHVLCAQPASHISKSTVHNWFLEVVLLGRLIEDSYHWRLLDAVINWNPRYVVMVSKSK